MFVKFVRLKILRKKYIFLLGSLILYAGGLLSKEWLISFPLIVFFYKFISEKNSNTLLKKTWIATKCTLPYFLLDLIWISASLAFRAQNFSDDFGNIPIMFSHPQKLIIGVTTALKLLVIPYNFSSGNILRYSWYFEGHYLWGAVIIIVFLAYSFLRIKNTNYKFALFLIGFLCLVGLCGRIEPIPKYLYIPLIGYCFVISLLIVDGVIFLGKKIKYPIISRAIGLFIVISILSAHYFSFQQCFWRRYDLGKNTYLAFSKVKEWLSVGSSPAVVYALGFHEFENGFQAFSPSTMKHALVRLESEIAPNWSTYESIYFIDSKRGVRNLQDLQRRVYLIFMSAANPANFELMSEFSIWNNHRLKGVDMTVSNRFKRYVFVYSNGKAYNLSDIVFPRTNIIFEIKNSDIQKVSVIGEFNNWNEYEGRCIQGEDGAWRIFLNLPPGKYPYKLVINAKKPTNNPCAQYYRDHSIFGNSSCLVVPNYGVPMGMFPTGNSRLDNRIIRLKKRLFMNPNDRKAHLELGKILKKLGYIGIASFEYEEANNPD